MQLFPFDDCVKAAKLLIEDGVIVHQKFNCAHCGVVQTMPDHNRFYTTGKCEECDKITDIEKDGCNYMLVIVPQDNFPK